MTLLDDTMRDLRHGMRLLRRNPGFTAVVLTILSVAIGASVTVFSIVDAWLLRPLNFPDPNRLVIGLAAQRDQPTQPAVFLFYRSYLGFKAQSQSLASVSAAFRRSYLVTGRGDAASVLGMAVSDEFFATMGVAPVIGRTLSSRDAGGAATVLSYGFWQQQFGGARDVIGTTVMLNGEPHDIVGVMPNGFDVRMLEQPRGAQLWTLIKAGERGYEPTGMGPVAVYARLRDGTSLAAAQAELNRLQQGIDAPFPEPQRLSQFAVLLTRLQDDNTRTIRATLMTVISAVGCLLLIACMNIGTLVLGRGLGRVHEAAVRAALGSGYGRLIRQFFTESLLLAVVGGAAGLALAAVALRLFASWDPLGMLPASSLDVNGRALVATGAVVGLAVIISGLIPAVRIAAADPQHALRAGSDRGTTRRGQRAQSVLLGGQLAVSLMLLVITSLLAQTFVTLTRAPLGFESSHLSVVDMSLPIDLDGARPTGPAERLDVYERVAAGLAAIPGVQGVAASTSPPLFSGGLVSVRTNRDVSQTPQRFSAQDVTSSFFETLALPIIAGRAFDRRDSSTSRRVVIVNELAARRLFTSARDAIGRQLFVDEGPPLDVIGVAGNTASVFFNTLEWQTNPIVYVPASQGFSTIANPERRTFGLSVHVRSSQPISLAEIRRAAGTVNPRVAVTAMESAESTVAKTLVQPRFRMTLLVWFSIASLLLTAVGVYGVVAQDVARRTREIGIRVALGARARPVIGLVARGALTTAAVGALTGCAAALALAGALKGVLYGVDARDPISMLCAAAVLLGVALLAALGPALRATRIDPIQVLRSD